MINLRYHIVSLTAVFLALASGVLLGGTYLDKYTVDQLDQSITNAEERIRETRAENDRRKMIMAQYMAERIGQRFSARITRLRSFGIIAQLDASFVEGTIPMDTLSGGPFSLDARETHMRGARRSFTVGQAVRVRVVSADAALGRVEFALDE